MHNEDEDVTFENSPLHQVLHAHGVTNIETEPLADIKERKDFVETQSSQSVCLTSTARSQRDLNFFQRVCLGDEADKLIKQKKKYLSEYLRTSPTVIPDDKVLLYKALYETCDEDRDSHEEMRENNWTKIVSLVLVSSVVYILCLYVHLYQLVSDTTHSLVSTVCRTLSLDFQLLVNSLAIPLSFSVVIGIPLSVVTGLVYIKFVTRQMFVSEIDRKLRVFYRFENCVREVISLQNRLLSQIKFTQLAALGFTIVNNSYCRQSMGKLIRGQTDHLCFELKRAIISGNVTLFQDILPCLLQAHDKVEPDEDFMCLQGVTRWLKDLKATSSLTPVDELSESSTDICENSVSDMKQFLSGFVTYLVLCLISEFKNDKDDPIECLSPALESSNVILRRHQHKLSRALQNHLCLNCVGDPDTRTTALTTEDSRQCPVEQLTATVGSLDVHLKEAFIKTRELSNHLEERTSILKHNHPDQKESLLGNISQEERNNWTQVLDQVKLKLEACRTCLDQSRKRLASSESVRHDNITSETTDNTEASTEETSRVFDNPQSVVKIVPAHEPVIEDQVFEAVVESDHEEDGFPKPRFCTEDEAQQHLKREDIRQFRQELNAVVGHRAVEMQHREERALAKARGEILHNSTHKNALEKLNTSQNNQDAKQPASSHLEPSNSKPETISMNYNKESSLNIESNSTVSDLIVSNSDKTDKSKQQMENINADDETTNKDSLKIKYNRDLAKGNFIKHKFDIVTPSIDKKDLLDKPGNSKKSELSRKLEDLKPDKPMKTVIEDTVLERKILHLSEKRRKFLQSLSKTESGHYNISFENGKESSSSSSPELMFKISPENTSDLPKQERNDNNIKKQKLSVNTESKAKQKRKWKPLEKPVLKMEIDFSNDGFTGDNTSFEKKDDEEVNKTLSEDKTSNKTTLEKSELKSDKSKQFSENTDPGVLSSSEHEFTSSQHNLPKKINPEAEGFKQLPDSSNFRSRHFFTASQNDDHRLELLKEYREEQKLKTEDGNFDSDDDPNTTVSLERSPPYVNISHVSCATDTGSYYEITKQKDIDVAATQRRNKDRIFTTSFATGLARIAASKAKNFNFIQEERFGDSESDEEENDS